MGNFGTYFTTIFGLLVAFGVLAMVLGNVTGTNQLMIATGQSITGLTKALEGR